jgi:hypothetical protein
MGADRLSMVVAIRGSHRSEVSDRMRWGADPDAEYDQMAI